MAPVRRVGKARVLHRRASPPESLAASAGSFRRPHSTVAGSSGPAAASTSAGTRQPTPEDTVPASVPVVAIVLSSSSTLSHWLSIRLREYLDSDDDPWSLVNRRCDKSQRQLTYPSRHALPPLSSVFLARTGKVSRQPGASRDQAALPANVGAHPALDPHADVHEDTAPGRQTRASAPVGDAILQARNAHHVAKEATDTGAPPPRSAEAAKPNSLRSAREHPLESNTQELPLQQCRQNQGCEPPNSLAPRQESCALIKISSRANAEPTRNFDLRVGASHPAEILAAQIVDRCVNFCRSHIRTHTAGKGDPGASSSPPKSTQSTSSPASPNKKRSRQSRTEKGNDEGDESDHGQEYPSKRNTKPEPKKPLLNFACPYAKFDPERFSERNEHESHYRNCAKSKLPSMNRIKQHLKRTHKRPEYYCANCYQEFDKDKDFHKHQRQREEHPCKKVPVRLQEMISPKDWEKIEKIRFNNNEKTWRSVFQLLFPNAPQPSSVYQCTEDACIIEHFVWLLKFGDAEEWRRLLRPVLSRGVQSAENGDAHKQELLKRAIEIALPLARKECEPFFDSLSTGELDDPQSLPGLAGPSASTQKDSHSEAHAFSDEEGWFQNLMIRFPNNDNDYDNGSDTYTLGTRNDFDEGTFHSTDSNGIEFEEPEKATNSTQEAG